MKKPCIHNIQTQFFHNMYVACNIVWIFIIFFNAAHTQRLLKLQTMLRRAPSYRTLELQLIEWQERELFEYFVVVSLKKKPTKNSYTPEVTYQFPKVNILNKKGRYCFVFIIKILHSIWRLPTVFEVGYTSQFIKGCLYRPSFRVNSCCCQTVSWWSRYMIVNNPYCFLNVIYIECFLFRW